MPRPLLRSLADHPPTTPIVASGLAVPYLLTGPMAAGIGDVYQSLQQVPFPLGAPIVGLIVGLFAYRALEVLRAWSTSPPRPRPLRPLPSPPEEPEVGEPRPEYDEGELPPVVPPTVPEGAALTMGVTASPPERSVPAVEPTLWTPLAGARPFEYHTPSAVVSTAPPLERGFGQTLAIEFTVIVAALLFVHAYLFAGINRLVQLLGTLIYWPLPWPGLVANASLRRSLPDLVFVVYLAMMLAFCLAARVFSDPQFTAVQRRYVVYLFATYGAVELLTDVVFFTIGDRFLNSAFLLVRGFTGGLFFTGLLFATLLFPAPTNVARRWPRDPRATLTFLGTGGLAIALATGLLYVLYHSAGIGRDLIPFAILLLIPVTAITIWGAIGRLLYDRQLRHRPVPTVEAYHPKVSIVIPAYNEEAGIEAVVQSADAAAGLYPGETEILVANDGSRDGTLERARAAIGLLRHASGAVIDLPHGGKSNALNGALAASTGEIIIRIDGDARISTTLGFGAMVPHFADPEVGGVQGLILPLQQDGWTRKLRFMEIAWNHLYLRRAMMATRSTQVVDGAFCAYRRADLVRLGGWVAWNGEDTEITLRVQRIGYRTRFETGAAAFEDVPADYESLRKQRIRWNRGGLFAHRRHLGALFGDAFEFGGLAILLWLTFFIRGGLRTLIWAYALLATVLLGLPTLLHVAIIAAILLIPRGIAIGYYLVKFGKWQFLTYVPIWPVAASVKQFFAIESYGSMLPGSAPEFAE